MIDQTVFVGGDSGAAPHTFDGRIDEIALYPRALRPDEIARIFAIGGVDKGGAGTQQITVQGNFIGVDKSGSVALSNGLEGIDVNDSFNNTIGGTAGGAGNLVSGNADNGILLTGHYASGNTVAGNLVGTDLNGTAALGNAGFGVEIANGAPSNTIGGASAAARNVISANHDGLVIATGASNNLVEDNLIGTRFDGSAPLGNIEEHGILDLPGPRTTRSAASRAGRATSSRANGVVGVVIQNGSTANTVAGNFIGIDGNGTFAIPNLIGVEIDFASIGNTVGGTSAASRNVISGNTAQRAS